MKPSLLAAPVIASLALAFAAKAQGPVPTPKNAAPPTVSDDAVDDSVAPPEQKEHFKIFTGTWRCDGKAATELADDLASKVTIAFRPELGGRWLGVKIEEQKQKLNPKAATATELWGYSAALGGWVRNGADSQGGFSSGTSLGWVGERFSWTTDTAKNGKRVKTKDTFTKVSDKELTFERALDASGAGDAYRVIFEGTCKR